MRDTDDDRGIERDVTAEVDRIVDRRVEQDDLDQNTKKILTNIVQTSIAIRRHVAQFYKSETEANCQRIEWKQISKESTMWA